MKMLRAKLYELERQKKYDEISVTRKTQVGSGDRSERIRTYNFPQSRITDHRVNFTLHDIHSTIKSGDIDLLITTLKAYYEAERIAAL
jgi:peptide chain release factor 1